MSEEREDIIFQLKVEGGDALTEMERFKKSIIQTKEAQGELTKAYKAGNITLDEFVQEQVRLEAILKRQQSSYNNVQKSVTGVKTQLDKLIDSNQKISKDLQKTSKSFQDVAGNINIAGVNMGGLTTKLASFANPATAAVGIVGALGAAYARSTVGAKDLAFAQSQLAFATTQVTNSFASMFSSGEDGEGLISKITDILISRVDPILALTSKLSALNQEKFEDLGRTEIEVRDKVNQRLEDNQELLTEIQSDQTKYNEKIEKSFKIIDNIRDNERDLVIVMGDQLRILEDQLVLDKENETLQTQILLKKKAIGNVERDAEKKVQNMVRLQQNFNEAEGKRLKLLKDNDVTGGRSMKMANPKGTEADAIQAETDFQNFIFGVQVNAADKQIRLYEQTEAEKSEIKKREAQKQIDIDKTVAQAKLVGATMVANSLTSLFEEGTEAQKAFALITIGIDTAEAISGLTAASEQNALNGVSFGAAGIIQFATGIARILTNIASAKNYLGFADGGWTGPGDKYKPAGIVHADEYVVPKNIVHSQPAQYHLSALESMRIRGYSDGGLVTNSLTSDTNQSMMISNLMKSMPAPIIGVEEITRVQNRISVKQKAAGGSPFQK